MAEETKPASSTESVAVSDIVSDVPISDVPTADEEKIGESASFKEESNIVGELPDPEKKALDELKQLVEKALINHEFTRPVKQTEKVEDKPAEIETKIEEEAKSVLPVEVVNKSSSVVSGATKAIGSMFSFITPKHSVPVPEEEKKAVETEIVDKEAPEKVEEPAAVVVPEEEKKAVEEEKKAVEGEVKKAPGVSSATRAFDAIVSFIKPKHSPAPVSAPVPEEEKKVSEEVTPPAVSGDTEKIVSVVTPETAPAPVKDEIKPAEIVDKSTPVVPADTKTVVPEIAPSPVKEEKKPADTTPVIPADTKTIVPETKPSPVKEEKKPAEIDNKTAPVTPAEPKPSPVKEEPKPVEIVDKSIPIVPADTKTVETVPETGNKTAPIEADDTKTVEAIEESIVPVATPPVPAEPQEVSIWGIPLLADERSDTVLLKFLRARDFKVSAAFAMLKSVVLWRKEFGIDALIDEDLGNEQEKVVFMHGNDKEGHPVCYNAYGEFQNKELYHNTLSDEEKRTKFLRWRIQFLERSIRKLDFSPDGVCTLFQVNDLKNSPGPFKRELRLATNQALQLLQDNYPEFVAKQVFVNVPWWYLAFYKMINPFFTQRTKSKFVFAGPSRTAETLFKYISPEQVPVQYGGLSKDEEQEFTLADAVTEEIIKPTTKHTIEFPITGACQLVWEVRFVGGEVSYGAEFVPEAEGGYTVIIQKSRKIAPSDEPVVSDTFKTGDLGKVVLTFDNQTSKKKKVLYRSKTKQSVE